jgi:hypothetical protein
MLELVGMEVASVIAQPNVWFVFATIGALVIGASAKAGEARAEAPVSLRQAATKAMRSTVGIGVLVRPKDSKQTPTARWSGSGVAITSTLVVTCNHVINNAIRSGEEAAGLLVAVDAEWGDRNEPARTYAADLYGYDSVVDLATLQVRGVALQPIQRASSSTVEVGDEVFFVGHPAIGASDQTLGIPALGIGVVAAKEKLRTHEVIRVDGNVNLGNSGGGLFSRATGDLVAIVSSKALHASPDLVRFAKTEPSVAMKIAGVDPILVARRTVEEMIRTTQLGVGFAISIDAVPLSQGSR